MPKYLILGAGRIAKAIAYDLIRSNINNEVVMIDKCKDALAESAEFVKSKRLGCYVEDITNYRIVANFMSNASVAIAAASYEYNYNLTKLALENNCHFVDLGGNNDIVKQQFKLNTLAKEKGLAAIPDCGLAPGLTNCLVGSAMRELGSAKKVKIRVGGLPQKPQGPLKYKIVFSPRGLINEYIEDCYIIEDGKIKTRPGMSDLEHVLFEGFPQLEAFNTSGGASTLPQSYVGRVKELDYKTIRYPGHYEEMRQLLIKTKARQNEEGRKELEKIIENLCSYESKDVVLLRVDVSKNSKTIRYELIDFEHENGLTAMMRTTGFTASIVAQMLAGNKIKQQGVLRQEFVVPTGLLCDALKRRGVTIKRCSF